MIYWQQFIFILLSLHSAEPYGQTNTFAHNQLKSMLTTAAIQKNVHISKHVFFSRFFQKWFITQVKFLLHCSQWIKTLHICFQTPYKNYLFWNNQEKWQKGTPFLEPLWWSSLFFFKSVQRKDFWLYALLSVMTNIQWHYFFHFWKWGKVPELPFSS